MKGGSRLALAACVTLAVACGDILGLKSGEMSNGDVGMPCNAPGGPAQGSFAPCRTGLVCMPPPPTCSGCNGTCSQSGFPGDSGGSDGPPAADTGGGTDGPPPADTGGGSSGGDGGDGSAADPTVLVAGVGQPFGVVADSVNVYYTDQKTASLGRCSVHGCNRTPSFFVPTSSNAGPILLTAAPKLAWAIVASNGALYSVDPGGGGATNLGFGISNALWMAAAGDELYATSDSDRVYHATATAADAGGADILYPGTTGGVATTAIAADAAGICFGELGTHRIYCCQASTGCGAQPSIFHQDGNGHSAVAIALDGTNLYWADDAGSVSWCPRSGCASPNALYTFPHGPIALSTGLGGSLVMASQASGVITRCTTNPAPSCAGSPINYGPGKPGVQSVFVDSSYVFWTNIQDGTVHEAPL